MSSPWGKDDPRTWQMSETPIFVASDESGKTEYRVFHYQATGNDDESSFSPVEGWMVIPYFEGAPYNPVYEGMTDAFINYYNTPKEAIGYAKRCAALDHDENGIRGNG